VAFITPSESAVAEEAACTLPSMDLMSPVILMFQGSNVVCGGSRIDTLRFSVRVYRWEETVRAEGGYTVATGKIQTNTAIANKTGAPGLSRTFKTSKILDRRLKSCSMCRIASVRLRKTSHMCCEKAAPTASVMEALNPVTSRSDIVVTCDCWIDRSSVLVPSSQLKKMRWLAARSKPGCVRVDCGMYGIATCEHRRQHQDERQTTGHPCEGLSDSVWALYASLL
jgi:hypothetical protein